MKVVIAGQAKSGTTALYHALRQSMPGTCTCLFEPHAYSAAPGEQPVLAKVLLNERLDLDSFAEFGKKILLVRDPRDNLVSRLLYAPYDQAFVTDAAKLQRFIGHLERKQRDPAGVSLLALLETLGGLAGEDMLARFARRHRLGEAFDAAARGYFVYKYEDLVAGRYAGLEQYLGWPVRFDGEVEEAHRRVARSRRAGDWRDWFTQADVEHFRGLYHPYLLKYGYAPEWRLNPAPEILPEHATGYVLRLARERRAG